MSKITTRSGKGSPLTNTELDTNFTHLDSTKAEKDLSNVAALPADVAAQLKGDKGDPGIQGNPGAKGDKGDKGDKGEDGYVGADGARGIQGIQGVKGDKGDKGNTGTTGAQGPVGPIGPQGVKGDTGATGAKGATGATGATGAKGDKGDKGDRGSQGIQGIQGIQGPRGSDDAVARSGDTMTGSLGVQGLSNSLKVGDISGDNYTEIKHTGSNSYGFDFQHRNASVVLNQQGTTNEVIVLGDVDSTSGTTLFGIGHSTDGGVSWAKKLNYTGTGEMYIGSAGTSRVFHNNYHPNADKWTTPRTITLGGDLSGSVSIDGSSNVTLSAQVADDSHNHTIANTDGLQAALNGKVDDSQVLTNVPANAVFTDTNTVYSHPTYAGDDINLDTGALSGATVISDLDFNVTTDGLGHVTDANATYSTRNLTAANIGAAPASHSHSYLPLSGGTLTGNLTLNSATPEILFNGTSDAGVDMAIRATPEGLDFYEPEDGNKIHFQILDDAGVNSPFGYKVGSNTVFHDAYHPNADKWTTARTLSLTGDVTGSVSWDGSGNATLSTSVGDAETIDGYDSTRLHRRVSSVSATASAGWVSVAECTSGRKHSEIIVSDAESGDHAFIRIDWMRSYADSNFSVLQVGGHANRITGARVLYQTSDNTYGKKILQVYVTTTSNYGVRVSSLGDPQGFGAITATTPVTQNSISGYAVHGSELTNLQDVTLAAEEGIKAGGNIYANNTQRVFADNYHPNADRWTTSRTLSLTGDVTGSVSWDGSGNASLSATVADDSHNHTIANIDGLQTALNGKQAAGTYNTVIGTDSDINTSGSTIIDNIYVTDGVITSMGTRTLTTGDIGALPSSHDMTLTLNGDVSGSATFTNMGNTTLSVTVNNDSHNHNHSDGNFTVNGNLNVTAGADIVCTSSNPFRFQRSSNSQTGQDDNISVYVDDSNIYFTHNNDSDGDASGFNFRYMSGGSAQNLINFSAGNFRYKGQDVFHTGYHPNADKWTTARSHTVTLTGDVTGSATQSVDGTGNRTWTVSTAVANDSHTHDGRYYTESESDSRFVNVTGDTMTGDLQFNSGANVHRGTHSSGYLVGSYNSVGANSARTNPIYTIGSAYQPSDTSFSNMYGIGYAHSNMWGGGKSNGWGFYVNENGRVFCTISADGMWHEDIGSIWGSSNDGSGSGLDADLLDGQHGSYYAPASHNHSLTLSGDVSGSGSVSGTISVSVNNDSHYHSQVFIPDTRGAARAPSYYPDRYISFDFQNTSDTGAGGDSWHVLQTVAPWSSYNNAHRQQQLAFTGTGGVKFRYATNDSAWAGWQTMWTSGNDGSGSGLDADLLDGQQGSYYAPASSIGNGTVTITTSGSASGGGTFTLNQSGNTTINISATDTNTTYNFSGSAFQSRNSGNVIAIDSATTNMTGYVNSSSAAGYADGGAWVAAYSSSWVAQIFQNFRNGEITTRGKNNGTWQSWRKQWDSFNDGSGSGLDADLLDGNHASAFATSGHGHTGLSSNGWGGITSSTSSGYIDFGPANSGHAHIYTDRPNFYFNKQLVVLGNGVWNSGNDGSGSGLDADLLDGKHASEFVYQLGDTASPNYQTPSSRRVDPNGSNPTNAHHAISTFGNNGNVTGQLATHFVSGEAYTRAYNSSWSGWRKQWDASNDGSGSGLDADLLDGNHASAFWKNSGSWRGTHTDKTRVYGVSSGGGEVWFGYANGKGNIIVDGEYYASEGNSRVFHDTYHPNADKWTTGRAHTVTLTGDVTGTASQTVDGSGNKTWTLNTVVANNSHSHDYVVEGGTSFSGEYPVAVRTGTRTMYSDGNIRFRGSDSRLSVDGNILIGGNNVFHDGYHPNADKWTTARTISLSGDLNGSVSLDGSTNVTLSAQVVNNSHTHNNYFPYISSTTSSDTFGTYILSKTDGGFSGAKPSGSHNGVSIISTQTHTGNYFTQLALDTSQNQLWIRSANNTSTFGGWTEIWASNNDGSGSGLDADLLDGLHASSFARTTGTYSIRATGTTQADVGLSNVPNWSSGTFDGRYLGKTAKAADSNLLDGIDSSRMVYGSNSTGTTSNTQPSQTLKSGFYDMYRTNTPTNTWYSFINMRHNNAGNNHGHQIAGSFYDNNLWNRKIDNGTFGAWTKSWSSANDGSGSGLDADLLDGKQPGDLSVNYANTANTAYGLRTYYVGGQKTNPQTYFGRGIGLRVAMTGVPSVWADTLWINGYSGTDVKNMCALHTLRNGQPRMYISTQACDSSSYGAYHEFWTTFNDGSGSGLDADLLDGQQASAFASVSHSHSNYLTTTGKAADANKLDGIDSGSFLRSDATDYLNGVMYVRADIRNETAYRDHGVYGHYDSYKTNHIWSMGSSYRNSPSGANFGNLYGFAYKHTNNGTGGTMGGGHMAVWCQNGTPYVSMGNNLWAKNNITAYSDARVKTNLKPIPNALEKVTQLTGYTYNRTDLEPEENDVRHAGVIAQEVLEVLPEVVTGGPTDNDPDNHYSVAYGNMVALLIEAIKEQQTQINELKARLN